MNLNPFGFDSVEEFLFSFIVTLFGTLLLPSTVIGYAVWFAAKQRKTAAAVQCPRPRTSPPRAW